MSLAAICDDALPGLRIVADEALFTGAMSEALARAGRFYGRLASVRIVRIRHRQGERAILQAEFVFDGPQEAALPASIWLFAGNKAERRAKVTGEQPLNAPVYEPTSAALVYFFPADPYVPELAEFVSDPDRFQEQLLPGYGETVGGPEVARFRPGIGATFKWRVADGRCAYVKIQKDSDAQTSAIMLEELRSAASGTSFSVPRPLGFAPEINAFAMEEVTGEIFGHALAGASRREALAITEKALDGLSDLHACAIAPRQRKDRLHFVSRALAAAQVIAGVEPDAGDRAHALADYAARANVPLAAAPTHCDIKLEHIALGGKVVFLDLDSLALADPLYDYAMLSIRARVAARSGLFGKGVAAAVSRSVHAAALGRGGPDAAARLAWLSVCAALQLARHFAQNPSPRSASMCRFALKAAEACMDTAPPQTAQQETGAVALELYAAT